MISGKRRPLRVMKKIPENKSIIVKHPVEEKNNLLTEIPGKGVFCIKSLCNDFVNVTESNMKILLPKLSLLNNYDKVILIDIDNNLGNEKCEVTCHKNNTFHNNNPIFKKNGEVLTFLALSDKHMWVLISRC